MARDVGDLALLDTGAGGVAGAKRLAGELGELLGRDAGAGGAALDDSGVPTRQDRRDSYDAVVEDVLITDRNGELWEIPARPAIDANRARQMSLHVLYEIEALGDIKRALWFDGRYDERDFPEGSIRRARGNGLLEAFALHVRALDDFLYKDQIASKGPRRADAGEGKAVGVLRIDANCAIALDFVIDGQNWIDAKPPRHAVLDRARRRSNQHLMHLDWRRVEQVPSDAYEKGTTWPVDAMFDAIAPAILAFIEHVRHGLVVPDFSSRALAIRERSHPGRMDDEELGLDRLARREAT